MIVNSSFHARIGVPAGLLAGLLLLVATELPPGAEAQAAVTRRVDVTDDGFNDRGVDGNGDPRTTRIVAGDTVVWVWVEGNESPHTSTSLTLPPSAMSWDSDQPCEDDPEREVSECRLPPNSYAVTFPEPGTFRYQSETDLSDSFLGTIEVLAPGEASPSPSDGPSDGSEPPASESPPPSGDPSSSPDSDPPSDEGPPPSEDGPTPEETEPTDQPPPSDQPDDGPSSPISRRAGRPGIGFQPAPPRTYEPASPGEPFVAPQVGPSGSFSPFPSAPPLPSEDEGDLAVDIPFDDRGPPRGLVTGLAVASLLGSIGALLKFVLLAPPWV